MRRPILFATLAGAALGLAVAWIATSALVGGYERQSERRIALALAAGGHTWASVDVDGTLLTLSGTAPDEPSRENALEMLRYFGSNLVGANPPRDATSLAEAPAETPAAAPDNHTLQVLMGGSDIVISGMVAAEDPGLAQMLDALATLFPQRRIIDLSDQTESVPNGDWAATVDFARQALPHLPDASLYLGPGTLRIEALAESRIWQEGLAEMLQNMAPAGVALDLQIIAPRPVIAPFALVLDLESDPPLLACTARTEAEARRIMASVRAAGGLRADCQVGLGAPSDDWGDVAVSVLAVLRTLSATRAEIIGPDIRLDGLDTTNPQTAEIIDTLRATLPEAYSLSIGVNGADPDDIVGTDPDPVAFSITRDEDGVVTLLGATRDELTAKVLKSYAEAKFGYERVSDLLVPTANLPEGWQIRALAAVDALTLLEWGTATIGVQRVIVSGVTSLPDTEAEIRTLIALALGDDTVIALDLTHDETLLVQTRAAARELDPALCALRIAAILDGNQIIFAPASAVIEPSSEPTISAIAAVLHTCPSAAFEISGHTDSQGRSEMNQRLSQSRADSVLDALLAERLLFGDLVAVGYGSDQPIADNGTEEGRALNRRIEFSLLDGAEIETGEPETGETETTPDQPQDAEPVAELTADMAEALADETGSGDEDFEVADAADNNDIEAAADTEPDPALQATPLIDSDGNPITRPARRATPAEGQEE